MRQFFTTEAELPLVKQILELKTFPADINSYIDKHSFKTWTNATILQTTGSAPEANKFPPDKHGHIPEKVFENSSDKKDLNPLMMIGSGINKLCSSQAMLVEAKLIGGGLKGPALYVSQYPSLEAFFTAGDVVRHKVLSTGIIISSRRYPNLGSSVT